MITRAAFLTVFVRTRPGYTQQIQNIYKLHLHYNWQHITISWQAYPLQNLHRPWTVVRSCPGLTTVMLWSMVLQTTANSIKKLQWVQNNTDRIVLGAERWSHASLLLRMLHWLPVQQRIEYKVALLTFKVQHIDAVIPPLPNAGPKMQPQPAIGHYNAVSTFHNNDYTF